MIPNGSAYLGVGCDVPETDTIRSHADTLSGVGSARHDVHDTDTIRSYMNALSMRTIENTIEQL